MFEIVAGFVALMGISAVSTILMLTLSMPGISILAGILWLIWWPPRRARVPVSGRVMLPTACFLAIMLCEATLMNGAPPIRMDLRWLGWVAMTMGAGAAVVSARIWVRADRDRRIAGLLLLQLVFVGMAVWLVISDFGLWHTEYLPVAVSNDG